MRCTILVLLTTAVALVSSAGLLGEQISYAPVETFLEPFFFSPASLCRDTRGAFDETRIRSFDASRDSSWCVDKQTRSTLFEDVTILDRRLLVETSFVIFVMTVYTFRCCIP